MDRGDRRQDIFENDRYRQDFLKTLAEACQKTVWQVHACCLRNETALLLKRIAARVKNGTAKEAKSVLHHFACGDHPAKPARADESCAQIEFQWLACLHGRGLPNASTAEPQIDRADQVE
ncbi:MAG: hypothetical protein NT154_38265 [Verrucomicrobia bacterium]|nr:hypothetical protein [Verrucomicrobiota bacterium]